MFELYPILDTLDKTGGEHGTIKYVGLAVYNKCLKDPRYRMVEADDTKEEKPTEEAKKAPSKASLEELEAMELEDLKLLAKAKSIKRYGKMKRETLIERLTELFNA